MARNASEPAEAQQLQTWAGPPVYGGVLVGGGSTRMGQPKSLLPFQGTTLAAHVISVVRSRVAQTVLLGDGPVAAGSRGLTRVPDVVGLDGPLAGLLAALRWAPHACWIIAACDLPLLRVEALDWLLEQRRPDRGAILPMVVPGRVEPLLALYEPAALDLLEQLLQRGLWSPRCLVGEPDVHTPTPPAALRSCWTNVNSPDDYRRLSCTAGGWPTC